MYVVISKCIALSGDASRGLGDPFLLPFFPKRKTQHRRGEQEGEENKTMFIFDRRLGTAVAEGSNQGVQPEGMGLWKGQPGGGGNTGICH